MKKTVFISAVVIILDQIIKFWFLNNFKLYESKEIIHNLLNLTLVKNKGAAFNILNGNTLFLIIITILFLVTILYILIKLRPRNCESILFGVLAGGVIGNLIDRIFHGYVIDYIEFELADYITPVFNLADACIVVSAILLIIISIGDKNGNNSRRINQKNRQFSSRGNW